MHPFIINYNDKYNIRIIYFFFQFLYFIYILYILFYFLLLYIHRQFLEDI